MQCKAIKCFFFFFFCVCRGRVATISYFQSRKMQVDPTATVAKGSIVRPGLAIFRGLYQDGRAEPEGHHFFLMVLLDLSWLPRIEKIVLWKANMLQHKVRYLRKFTRCSLSKSSVLVIDMDVWKCFSIFLERARPRVIVLVSLTALLFDEEKNEFGKVRRDVSRFWYNFRFLISRMCIT